MMQVPFARPYFAGGEADSIAAVIESGWVSQGPRVRAFEEAFAELVGAPEAIATTSCTTALQLALYVSGVGPGDEVIVPSLTFIATANAVGTVAAHRSSRTSTRTPTPRPGRRRARNHAEDARDRPVD